MIGTAVNQPPILLTDTKVSYGYFAGSEGFSGGNLMRPVQPRVSCARAWEGPISTRLRLTDLMVRSKLVTEEDVANALKRQTVHGGRLGENLVAIGATTSEAVQAFMNRIPAEPADIAATGINDTELMGLLLKLIYSGRLESVRQFVDAIKLPYHIVFELVRMAVERKFLQTLGARSGGGLADISYDFTEEGRRWTIDALKRQGYIGPAPVTIEQFNEQVNLQKLTNEVVTYEDIRRVLADLTVTDNIVEQCGPALNSGRAMLMYGPPGNGKTSLAMRLANIFSGVIHVPYAVIVENQIIRVLDTSIHVPVSAVENVADDDPLSLIRHDTRDERWVACRRPFVVVGGELTLEMLDLRFDAAGKFYEAPLHMKALGGCFLIDDFGRQLVSPDALLNRWIVPLESRIDFLKLHTGKTFTIPFEELIIFSTNLEPEDLMDPAFLRRLPYKIEVGPPTVENYRRIFEDACAKQHLALTDEIFEKVVHNLCDEKKAGLHAYQPRFIVDQVVASCRFMGERSYLEPRYVVYALDNLYVRRQSPGQNTTAAKSPAKTAAKTPAAAPAEEAAASPAAESAAAPEAAPAAAPEAAPEAAMASTQEG